MTSSKQRGLVASKNSLLILGGKDGGQPNIDKYRIIVTGLQEESCLPL